MRASILTLAILTSGGAAADGWDLIGDIGFEETETDGEWRVVKTLPAGLEAALGEAFTITGYYVPIQAQAYVTNFLLVPDPADCPFCGSSGYGITLEVLASEPLPDMPEATEITVTGSLELVEDPHTYQAVRLTGARPVLGN